MRSQFAKAEQLVELLSDVWFASHSAARRAKVLTASPWAH
jgi:hypothetical protein